MRELAIQEIENIDGGFLFFVSSSISSLGGVSPVVFNPYPSPGISLFKTDGARASFFGYNLGKLLEQDFFVRRVRVYNITQEING
ncbi:MAG TPA: hypothetical protein ACQGQI_04080 [Xylella sp.]